MYNSLVENKMKQKLAYSPKVELTDLELSSYSHYRPYDWGENSISSRQFVIHFKFSIELALSTIWRQSIIITNLSNYVYCCCCAKKQFSIGWFNALGCKMILCCPIHYPIFIQQVMCERQIFRGCKLSFITEMILTFNIWWWGPLTERGKWACG